jgi:hypothetical protein
VAFTKRFILWLLLSLPVGIGIGAAFSAFLGEGSDLDRFTSAGNGGLAGAWTALIGATAAAGTTTMARAKLKAAGGSEFLTGLFVSFGLIVAALGLLRLLA